MARTTIIYSILTILFAMSVSAASNSTYTTQAPSSRTTTSYSTSTSKSGSVNAAGTLSPNAGLPTLITGILTAGVFLGGLAYGL